MTKIRLRLGFLWQVCMLQFRDYHSLAKAHNLLANFSEDLNANVATMTSQKTLLPSFSSNALVAHPQKINSFHWETASEWDMQ